MSAKHHSNTHTYASDAQKRSVCRNTHTNAPRHHMFILNRSVSLVWHRSSQEAGGFSHVEPSWQEKAREEVHGGPERHRRRLTCTGQEGHRHDTARAEVRVEVDKKKS